MRAFKSALSGKGLLAASVAVLSGHALAEDAGHVSFVIGNVSVSSPDGSTRALHRGDTITGGDRISTHDGRIQIRFTDGGFVSLQPNTVFGVDQYLYANRKPEETSLFFSLLQGGMRTITGLIGKVNKQSYKVHTPVATIGIRGTEYLASVTPTGLIVSVGSGFVNVANDRGDITAGAGQNIFTTAGGPPELTHEEPDIQAPGPGALPQGSNPVTVGDTRNGNGDYIFLFTSELSLLNSDLVNGTRPYFISYEYGGNAGGPAGALAVFDPTGSLRGTAGALLDLYDPLTLPSSSSSQLFSSAGVSPDTGLQATDVGAIGNLSWGAFTNGNTSINTVFDNCGDGCTGPITLAATDFLPYVIGTPATSNLGHGTASYSLQGGTAPRDSSGAAGTLDSFKIDVNLDFATMNLAMQLTMPASSVRTTADTYHVTTTGALPVGVPQLGTNNQFRLGSGDLTVTDRNNSCGPSGSSSCAASISGFFSGSGASQIGAAYEINNSTSGDTIGGAAALGMSGYNPATVLASGPGYSAAYAYHGTVSAAAGPTNVTGFSGGYNLGTNIDSSLNAQFDATGALQSATQNGNTEFDRGTGALADNTGSVGALEWGRWYSSNVNGDVITTPESTPSTATLANGDYLHYIIGPMAQTDIFAAFAANTTATYTYQGGTTATGTDGSTGQLGSGSTLTVTFGTTPTLAADLALNMSGGTSYQVTGSGIPVNVSVTYGTSGVPAYTSGTANFAASGSGYLSVGGTACGSSGACAASIQGFFAGQQAQQIGLGYSISDPVNSRTVNGAAAFGR